MKQRIEELYLSYFNNFITVRRFADYHFLTVEKACRIIEIGRRLNHRN